MCPSTGCLPHSCWAYNHDGREQQCWFRESMTDYDIEQADVRLPGQYSPTIRHSPTGDCRACRVLMDYLARQMVSGCKALVDLGFLTIEVHPDGQSYIIPAPR